MALQVSEGLAQQLLGDAALVAAFPELNALRPKAAAAKVASCGTCPNTPVARVDTYSRATLLAKILSSLTPQRLADLKRRLATDSFTYRSEQHMQVI